MRNV
ncbi:hypothetical protein PR048_015153 [Dryococelus australis]|jgi:hypothetical protein